MSKRRIFLTGASGFLGGHVAAVLLAAGDAVLAPYRKRTAHNRLAAGLELVNADAPDWLAEVRAWQPTHVVHAAWLGGVGAAYRDDWPAQMANVGYLLRILDALGLVESLRQVVALGSQAEYGAFEGRVVEDYPTRPTTAYGAAKLAALEVVRALCESRGINWQWLRVFSAFGPGEDAQWVIPHVINRLLVAGGPLELTAGAQLYDYAYAPDLAAAVAGILTAGPAPSGVFNLATGQAISLRSIVEALQKLTKSPTEVRFGAVPYRAGQVMCMEGDPTRFEQTFGPMRRTDLQVALAETVAYWRNRRDFEPQT